MLGEIVAGDIYHQSTNLGHHGRQKDFYSFGITCMFYKDVFDNSEAGLYPMKILKINMYAYGKVE
jgi:hypothetical protein